MSEIKDRIRDINIVSYSGGKDSTVTLELVLEALKGTDKQLIIMTADTLLEIPFYQEYVNRNRLAIQSYIDSEGINARMITVIPPWDKTFWVSVLGKGYPSSHHSFKWCTQQLKIDPITAMTEALTKGVEYMVFVGIRQAESARRAKTYKDKDFRPNNYAPILYWSTQEVWTHLLTEPCPWGNHEELVKVYKYASDECVYGDVKNVCIGNARYGCWICPLQTNSQLKILSFATGEDRYLLLKQYKDALQAMAQNWSLRSKFRRNGDEGVGPFLVEIRQELHGKLKELESKTGWQLIRPEEEEIIFKYWEADKDIHNIPNTDRPNLFYMNQPSQSLAGRADTGE